MLVVDQSFASVALFSILFCVPMAFIFRRVHELECQESLGNDGLEELLSRIATVSSPETSPRGHSVSKQLSGILKNMKCLEESLQGGTPYLSSLN